MQFRTLTDTGWARRRSWQNRPDSRTSTLRSGTTVGVAGDRAAGTEMLVPAAVTRPRGTVRQLPALCGDVLQAFVRSRGSQPGHQGPRSPTMHCVAPRRVTMHSRRMSTFNVILTEPVQPGGSIDRPCLARKCKGLSTSTATYANQKTTSGRTSGRPSTIAASS